MRLSGNTVTRSRAVSEIQISLCHYHQQDAARREKKDVALDPADVRLLRAVGVMLEPDGITLASLSVACIPLVRRFMVFDRRYSSWPC